ncbi:LamB/YcsF family protein [Blastococcus sp. MG754426]|nr:LamB/YcsF family protein [Blastococcus sp. MG754426]MCF6512477.1 LamB/YcsF family protein [Blastococcus sp. MG754427]MCF6736895.1 LamB/YcsF family protein [Blastococcus sp. KM273129]
MPGAAPAGCPPFRCETARVTAPGAPRIDLNADLGEGFGVWRLGDDDALLEVVSSANVACGFHAGDPLTMRRVCAAAVTAGVAIGAQVSYRDLAGFGRRFVDVAPDELAADVLYQLAALDGVARAAGGRVSYVKPHGALYNAVVHHAAQARAVVEAVAAYDAGLPLLGLPGSLLLSTAEDAGLPTVAEGFADRGYAPDGTLVPRGAAGALVHDPAVVAERAVRMAADGAVVAVDGSVVRVEVASVCVHGDTPGAVRLARTVRAALEVAGLRVGPFTG